MPRIHTLRTKRKPEGWNEIEPTLQELTKNMRDAEKENTDGKRKTEILWKIYKIHH
jgi:bud site selection protein 31